MRILREELILTTPSANSLKTRDKIGGTMSRTPASTLRTTVLWIQYTIISMLTSSWRRKEGSWITQGVRGTTCSAASPSMSNCDLEGKRGGRMEHPNLVMLPD